MSRRTEPRARRLALPRIPLRTVLVWTLPILVFAWLSVAGHAAGNAEAVTPKPGALLGGGAIAERFVPRANYGLHFTTVTVAPDGKSLKFYGDWNGRCAGFTGPVTAAFFKEVDLHGDGSFDGKGPLESTAADGRFEFRGRFTTAGSAAGTGRVRFTFRPDAGGGAEHMCDTGTVIWQTRTSAGNSGRPRPQPGRAYFGNTTQRLPILLRVSRDGRFVSQQAALWNAACKTNKTGLGRGTASPPVRIRSGRFSFTENYTETYGEFVAKITSTHAGVFGAATVAGTWRVKIDVRRADTKKRADSCDSGPISWSARL